MKGIILALVLAFSTLFPVSSGPQDVSPQEKPATTQEEQLPTGGKGWMAGMSLPRKEKFDYTVDIHLLFLAEEANKLPTTYAAFLHATSIWAQYVPVNFVFHFDTSYKKNKEGHLITPPRLIRVRFASLEKLIGASPSMLGIWLATARRLYLDDELESDYRRAVSVSMHEIGHLFGIPHVVGNGDLFVPTLTGDIRVDGSSRMWLMFPFEVKGNEHRWKPTPLEIQLAQRYIRNVIGSVAPITSRRRGAECNCNFHHRR